MLRRFRPKIGVEIHAQLLSGTKLFSDGSVNWRAPINTQVELFDCAVPGVLPKINWDCVDLAVRAARGCSCEIAPKLIFDRKHYVHWDLPAGYQITQHRLPLGRNGIIQLHPSRCIKIKQIHLEQDSGKSFNQNGSILVDLNRCGTGLIELVSEPEIVDSKEASLFVQRVHELLQDLEICSGNLEEGAMRIDVNVNLIEEESGKAASPRVELKNVNGIGAVAEAIEIELERQASLLDSNPSSLQAETRFFCAQTRKSILLRAKDASETYRYLPEYDLPEFNISNRYKDSNDADIFNQDRYRQIASYQQDYPQLAGLGDILLRLWTRPEILPRLFAGSVSLVKDPKFLLNWCVGPLAAILNRESPGFEMCISSESFAQLVESVRSGLVDKEVAKEELASAIKDNRNIQNNDLLLRDARESQVLIEEEIETLFKAHPERVAFLSTEAGRQRGSVDFFIGPLLKKFRGQISAAEISTLLKNKLKL